MRIRTIVLPVCTGARSYYPARTFGIAAPASANRLIRSLEPKSSAFDSPAALLVRGSASQVAVAEQVVK